MKPNRPQAFALNYLWPLIMAINAAIALAYQQGGLVAVSDPHADLVIALGAAFAWFLTTFSRTGGKNAPWFQGKVPPQ